jgi:pyruvate/2-oxoglutarate/acetoin dehydrogenase E1 component
MTEMDFRTAICTALDEELEHDDSVIFFGEDVAVAGGLVDKHGTDRVFDTPISELALAGAAYGSAIAGLRPVIEIMFGDFLPLTMDSLVNQAAKYWYLSNEQASVPLVVRSAIGGGGRFGAIHSQVPISWFQGVPGLKIVCPSTPADAKGLLKAAIRDDNPVLFLEHKRLYALSGEVDGELGTIGEAAVVREGTDVTLVSAMRTLHECVAAADTLAGEGVECEVIDLRTVRPVDSATILRSVQKTNRLVVVEEGPRTGGWAGEVLAIVAEQGLGDLDAILRLTTPDHPIPYSPPLEDAFIPGADAIAQAVRTL